MSVLINASTSTGLVQSADTSGEIELQSNGTTALKVNTNEGIQILNCLGVGNATPSTSGAGITFPATQSASSDANTLDDYEEGTWTGELRGSTARATTPVTTTGYYTKIGRQVTVTICFFAVNTTGATGDMQITGLPFATGGTANDMRFSGSVQSYGLAIPAAYNCADLNGGGSTTIAFQSFTNNGNWQNVQITAGATKFLITTITYFV